MLKRFAFFLAIGGLGVLFSSCQKPTLIGDELLEDDRIGIEVRDTLTVEARPHLRDSVLVYNPEVEGSSGLSIYPIGWMNEPVTGTFKGSVYAQFRPDEIEFPETGNAQVDSIVLAMQYDSASFYGPREELQSVEVYRVTEHIDPGIFHYSSEDFETSMQPLGTKENFVPRPDREYTEIDYTEDPPDTTSQPAQLRIRLDQAFGEEILNLDSTILASDDDFIQVIRGLHVRATKETNSLMSFNMYASQTRLRLYYNEPDTQKVMTFNIDGASAIISRQEHDYSNSEVGNYTQGPTPYDSVGFVQSLSGLDMKITLPEFEEQRDVLINQAQLKVTLKTESDVYPPINRLVLAKSYSTGSPSYIDDVLISIQNNVNRIFGGTLETNTVEGEEVQQYTMNLSNYYQDVADGMASRDLFITPIPKASRPYRSVVYGPSHTQYPMTFRIVYTVQNQ